MPKSAARALVAGSALLLICCVAGCAARGSAPPPSEQEVRIRRQADNLIASLKDKVPDIRACAATRLGKYGKKRAIAPLREARARETVAWVKRAMRLAIEELQKEP